MLTSLSLTAADNRPLVFILRITFSIFFDNVRYILNFLVHVQFRLSAKYWKFHFISKYMNVHYQGNTRLYMWKGVVNSTGSFILWVLSKIYTFDQKLYKNKCECWSDYIDLQANMQITCCTFTQGKAHITYSIWLDQTQLKRYFWNLVIIYNRTMMVLYCLPD